MVIIIHKLPVGSFAFLQCLSGTELPNLSGTTEISAEISNWRQCILPWWRGQTEHTDGRKSEGMIKEFEIVIDSECRSNMITKWDGDRRAEDERPIEADGETIEKI
jgi:hypothetical protein